MYTEWVGNEVRYRKAPQNRMRQYSGKQESLNADVIDVIHSKRVAEVGVGANKLHVVFSSPKSLTSRQPAVVNDQEIQKDRASVCVCVCVCVLLPLQSTEAQMHIIRAIDIRCHKQWLVYAYVY